MDNFRSRFLDWIREQPSEEGFRNDTVVRIVREGLGQGFATDFLRECVEEYCEVSDLPLPEAMYILEKHSKEHRINPFESNLVRSHGTDANWVEIANDFIKQLYYDAGVVTLKYWNGDFYEFKGTHYKHTSIEEVKSKVSAYVMYRATHLQKRRMSQILTEVLEVLKGRLFVPYTVDIPFYDRGLSNKNFYLKGNPIKKNIIAFDNGLLEIENLGASTLHLHDHCYFSTNYLPYNFEPGADCPIWKKFLSQTFDSEEVIELAQEWFGYNLLDHCNYQKFLLCVGSGANGKSVFLKVLSLLIGEGNYSSVGLENFDPKRTFTLAVLQGKMANIVNDMNEIRKTGEGLLKQFVAGEPITVERKYRDPFEMRSRAKLTMATNVLPRFADRSDGIWRRMILLSFKNKITDESKQDKRLMSDDWWRLSGELPGIFNWSLEGLRRLEERGAFKIPSEVKEDVEFFKNSSNSGLLFLKSYVVEAEVQDGKGVLAFELYEKYKTFCHFFGYRALNAHNFAREVRVTFPNASSSDITFFLEPSCSETKTKRVSRIWQGLEMREGYDPSLGPDLNSTL